MMEIKKIVGYGAVLITALILGKWYSVERDRIMSKGEPWIKSWTTIPGLIILIILLILLVLRLKYR